MPDNFFLENSGIYICFGTVSSSLITGFLLMRSNSRNNSRNNDFQLKRENEQRIWQEESERKKWCREKVYDSYKKSIHVLTKMVQAKFESEFYTSINQIDADTMINQGVQQYSLYWEFISELTIITANHPDKDLTYFQEQIAIIKDVVMEKPIFAQLIITQLMELDSRIKDVSK